MMKTEFVNVFQDWWVAVRDSLTLNRANAALDGGHDINGILDIVTDCGACLLRMAHGKAALKDLLVYLVVHGVVRVDQKVGVLEIKVLHHYRDATLLLDELGHVDRLWFSVPLFSPTKVSVKLSCERMSKLPLGVVAVPVHYKVGDRLPIAEG
jgi:hypothetical protein